MQIPPRAPSHVVPDATLQGVAEKFGTPTYAYDLDLVDARLQDLRAALPEAHLHYAVKANPCGAVLRYLAKRGLGAEVITEGELARARAAGFHPEKILLGGPRQDPPLIGGALAAGVRLVSLDSLSQAELWRGRDVKFLLRLNPALDPRTHEHLATGAASSKFGMTVEEVEGLAGRLHGAGKLAGFHVHAGSQIRDVAVYDKIFERLAPLYARFGVKTLDIGGGFAVPDFPLLSFAEKVRAFARRFGLKVILEPGRYLVADAGVLLTRVLHVKRGEVTHVIADAGMADLLRPALYGAAHPVRVLGAEGRAVERVDVDGPLCENADRLGRELTLPAPRPGDLLVVEQAGAYGLTMASNYASSLRPAEVTVQGERIRLARRRETVADVVRLECE